MILITKVLKIICDQKSMKYIFKMLSAIEVINYLFTDKLLFNEDKDIFRKAKTEKTDHSHPIKKKTKEE